MTDKHGIERRLTLRLMAYWEKLRGARPMPLENDINPEDLSDLWDHCFLVQVRGPDRNDYHYTYLGSAIVDAYRSGLPPEAAKTMVGLRPCALTASYERVIANRIPVMEEGEFNNLDGHKVKFRQCMLPLGHGGAVEAIFGGMRFKVFP